MLTHRHTRPRSPPCSDPCRPRFAAAVARALLSPLRESRRSQSATANEACEQSAAGLGARLGTGTEAPVLDRGTWSNPASNSPSSHSLQALSGLHIETKIRGLPPPTYLFRHEITLQCNSHQTSQAQLPLPSFQCTPSRHLRSRCTDLRPNMPMMLPRVLPLCIPASCKACTQHPAVGRHAPLQLLHFASTWPTCLQPLVAEGVGASAHTLKCRCTQCLTITQWRMERHSMARVSATELAELATPQTLFTVEKRLSCLVRVLQCSILGKTLSALFCCAVLVGPPEVLNNTGLSPVRLGKKKPRRIGTQIPGTRLAVTARPKLNEPAIVCPN